MEDNAYTFWPLGPLTHPLVSVDALRAVRFSETTGTNFAVSGRL